MLRVSKKLALGASLIGVLAWGSVTQASPLNPPNQTALVIDNPSLDSLVASTVNQPYTITTTNPVTHVVSTNESGTYTEDVFHDITTGGLDFLYQFTETINPGDVTSFVTDGFQGFSLDVGYTTETPTNFVASSPSSQQIASGDTVSTVGGSAVTFSFVPGFVEAGGTSPSGSPSLIFVINTNATNFTSGNIAFQDNENSGDLPDLAPTSVPLPATVSTGFALFGGFIGFTGLRRRIAKTEQAIA